MPGANDFADMVNDAVSTAEDEIGGVDPMPAPDLAPPSDGEPEAAQDDWAPPSREEVEALQRDAELGRKYSPYAKDIDGLLQRAFQPQGQGAPAAPAPAKAPEPDDYDTYFGSAEAISKWWSAQRGNAEKGLPPDPTALVRGLKAFVAREIAPFKKGYEGERDNQYAVLEDLVKRAIQADHRFVESPDWKQHGSKADEAFKTGKYRDFATAYEAVKNAAALEALKAGATPAQAAKVGQQVAESRAGSRPAAVPPRGPDGQFLAPKRAPAQPVKRPQPSKDAAPTAGGRKPTGKADGVAPFDRHERAGKYETRLVEEALVKLGVR